MNEINKELKALLDNNPWDVIPYDELIAHDPQAIRGLERALSEQEEPLPIPEDLEVENRLIGTDEQPIRLRIYRPKGKSKLPIMLYFHGGAFIFGVPEQYDFNFYRLALDAEILIVSVDYRLAPEHPFPAGIEDGYKALNWLLEHGHSLGGDKDNIMIAGSSAGGTIAMSVTHMARDLGNNSICFQYLLYPPTDNRLQTASMETLKDAPMQTRHSAKYMWQHYLGKDIQELPKYAVPLREFNFSNLPPACIVVCEFDPLRDEALAYAEKLKQAEVETQCIEIKGAVHVFDFFPCQLAEDYYQLQLSIIRKAMR